MCSFVHWQTLIWLLFNMTVCPVGARFCADRQTYRHMIKLVVTFKSFANAHNKFLLNVLHTISVSEVNYFEGTIWTSIQVSMYFVTNPGSGTLDVPSYPVLQDSQFLVYVHFFIPKSRLSSMVLQWTPSNEIEFVKNRVKFLLLYVYCSYLSYLWVK
jgi:hypothetical protein